MDHNRRILLRTAGIAAAVLTAGGWRLAHAADATNATYDARTTADAMRTMGLSGAAESKDIIIKAPDVAENGASVPIEIASDIPGTDSMVLFIDKNPFPFAGSFDFSKGAVPYVSLRVKIAESSNLRVVATAAGKHYTAVREVKVTIGGCGA